MEEIWKNVKEYDNYQISNFGNVRNKIRMKEVIPFVSKQGYKRVNLWKNNKSKKFSVHRLVWETFNGIVPDGLQVNHIDENKLNNRLDNLNLMTHTENNNWGTGNKRRSETLKKPVLQYTVDGELVKEWNSIDEAAENGFCQSSISHCCNGSKYRHTHKGFIWKFKNVQTDY